MDIKEALATRENRGLCPECFQPVRPHKKGTTGQEAHFEHRTKNPQCRFSTS